MTISWDKVGKNVSDNDVRHAEATLGLPFGEQFRAFLLKTNGGVPKERVVDYGDSDQLTVTRIFDLPEILQVARQYRSELDLPVHQIPIGFVNESDLLVLDGAKVVVHLNVEGGIGRFGSSSDDVAGTFDEFVSKLRKAKRGKPSENAQFVRACENGEVTKIQKLLASGVDWTVAARPAFEAAFRSLTAGDLTLLTLLLEAGSPRDVKGDYGFSVGVTPAEYLRKRVANQQKAIGIFGESSDQGVKTKAEIERLEALLAKYFVA